MTTCRAALAIVVLALLAAPALADTTVIDGDTLRHDGVMYRLHGIDAPERRQVCADGWPAGLAATAYMRTLVAGRDVTCEGRSTDRYGRTVGVCRAGGADVGAAMVRSGMAWAYRQYSVDYVEAERLAIAARAGVHGHQCQPAWEWRR